MPEKDSEFILERAIERIKEIQQRLQDGQASFDQSLQLFEEADGLIQRSQDYLQRAELRLRILGDEGKEA
jgi:exodeoxyribonuclease VII small subunit